MTPTPPFGRILREGDVNEQVRAVKRALARELGINDPAMGTPRFGTTLKADLISFQRRHSLAVDGVYGPLTHARLWHYADDFAYLLYAKKPPPRTDTVQLPATFTPTHNTDGLPGFPAIDVFARSGTRVLAPAAGTLRRTHLIPWNIARRVGGWTTYLDAENGDVFFMTHFGECLPSGSIVGRGDDMGSVGVVPRGAWAAHIHEGLKRAV